MPRLRATKCLLKTQFYSEWLAEAKAADINLDFGYEKLFVYRCQSCGFYHLTSQNK